MSNIKTTSSNKDVLLELDDLHVWYELKKFGFGHAGYVRAVDGVSFELKQGEAMACVGESGCGKSSLMKTIIGLNRPTKGDVIFDDEKLTETHGEDLRKFRAKIGYIQQDPFGALATFMTIQRILEEPLIINGFSDKE
ncbi:MAG TPA: ATP-binding cassette domain-containing protein, partial [Anaerolineae bacterium]|nr:ATP-binding cassette domain-containing protein [Anaerolineae bacterium]